MKKIIPLIILLAVITGCNKHKDDVDVNPQADTVGRTPIQKDFCYEIHDLTSKGALVNLPQAWMCMVYVGTYGDDFESAYAALEPDIQGRLSGIRKYYSSDSTYDPDRLEIRCIKAPVYNAPNDKLEYTYVIYFMYNYFFEDYVWVACSEYGVIDSEGNLYSIDTVRDD